MKTHIYQTSITVLTSSITCCGYFKLKEMQFIRELNHEIEKSTDELCTLKYSVNSKEFKDAKIYQKKQEIKRKNKIIESSLTFQILDKLGYNIF